MQNQLLHGKVAVAAAATGPAAATAGPAAAAAAAAAGTVLDGAVFKAKLQHARKVGLQVTLGDTGVTIASDDSANSRAGRCPAPGGLVTAAGTTSDDTSPGSYRKDQPCDGRSPPVCGGHPSLVTSHPSAITSVAYHPPAGVYGWLSSMVRSGASRGGCEKGLDEVVTVLDIRAALWKPEQQQPDQQQQQGKMIGGAADDVGAYRLMGGYDVMVEAMDGQQEQQGRMKGLFDPNVGGGVVAGYDVMVDMGDSWLRLHTLKLPAGGSYEIQVRRVCQRPHENAFMLYKNN